MTDTSVFKVFLLFALVMGVAGRVGLAADSPPEEVIAAIRMLGGRVNREQASPGSPAVGVDLQRTKVTDPDLQNLKGMTQLQHLELGNTSVTDVGLQHLKALPQLTLLYLQHTKVTDAGLEHLKGLTQLEHLDLGNTQVTDAGLEHLKGLKQLTWLNLADTKVTDVGLEHLKAMTQLDQLDLGNTKVADAGLEHLKGLTRLTWLNLQGTKVTDAGTKNLRKMLPALNIVGIGSNQVGGTRLIITPTLMPPFPHKPTVTPSAAPRPKQYPEVQEAMRLLRGPNPDMRNAIKKLEEASQKYPEVPSAQVLMYRILTQVMNQPAAARAQLDEAITTNPSDPEPYLILGSIALQNRRLSEAATDFEKAQHLLAACNATAKRKATMEHDVLSGLAQVAETNQDWPEAEKQLRKLLKVAHEDLVAHQRLARSVFCQGKTEDSFAILKAAKKIDRENAEHNNTREVFLTPEAIIAQYYEQSEGKNSKNPRIWFDAALESTPKDLATRQAVAFWALDKGNLPFAKEQAEAALRIEASDPKYSASIVGHMLCGLVAVQERDWAAAEENLRQVILQDPTNFAARNNLALALADQDDPAKTQRALAYAEGTYRDNLKNPNALSTLGWVYYRLGQFDQATLAFQQSIKATGGKLDPNMATRWAYILHHRKQDWEAKALLTEILKIDRAFAMRPVAQKLYEAVKDAKKPDGRAAMPADRGSEEAIEEIQKLGGSVNRERGGPNSPVTWASLNGTKVTDVGVQYLKGFTQLKNLYLRDTNVTDAGLAHLRGLTELSTLYVQGAPITDAGLEHFKTFTKLLVLELKGTKITGTGLEHLKGLTQLHMLDLTDTKVTDAGLACLKDWTQLRHLSLDNTQVTDAGIKHLRGLKQLTSLNLRGTQVTDAGLEYLAEMLQLSRLELGNTQMTDAGMKQVKGLTQLQRLGISGTQVTDAGLEHLKGLTQLTSVELGNTKMTDAGLEHLKGLVRLADLGLQGTQVTDTGLQHLKDLPQLQRLHLNDTKVTGLEYITGLSGLRGVDLRGAAVTDAGLEHLKGLTQLESLWVDSNKVTDAGLEHIKELTRLRGLDLRGTTVTDAGVQKLQQKLPRCYILANTAHGDH